MKECVLAAACIHCMGAALDVFCILVLTLPRAVVHLGKDGHVDLDLLSMLCTGSCSHTYTRQWACPGTDTMGFHIACF